MTRNIRLLLLLIGLGLVLAGCGLREGTIVYDTGYPTIGGDSDGGGGSGGSSGGSSAIAALPSCSTVAPSGTWQAVQISSASSFDDEAIRTKVDGSGNIYVAGHTYGELAGQTKAGTNATRDFFVAKYNADGALSWLNQFGSSNDEPLFDMTIDKNCDLYVTGYIKVGNNRDIIVYKLDGSNSGAVLWSDQRGGSHNTYIDLGHAIETDSSGYVYVVAQVYPTIDGLASYGYYDTAIIKYDSGGNRQWTKRYGSEKTETGRHLVIDANDNLYMSGQAVADGSTGNFLVPAAAGASGSSFFLARLNTDGDVIWVQRAGSSSQDLNYDLKLNSAGNLIGVGQTFGSFDGNTKYGSGSNSDYYLIKYDSDGNKLWSTQYGSAGKQWGYGLAIDSSDNIYLTASTDESVDSQTYSGGNDIILAKYSDNGTKQWLKMLGTAQDEIPYSLVVDSSDNIHMIGATDGTLVSGSPNPDGSGSTSDYFLLKFDSNGVPQ
ncbi:MAG: SBBP repeat-containing protein [Deltaproteobacteria bacterium]